jgi:hypothetical protein
MNTKVVPQIKAPATRSPSSDTPTYVVAGLSLAGGALGGWAGGAPGAALGSFASLILFGGTYSILAWLFCWPRLGWSFLTSIVGNPLP